MASAPRSACVSRKASESKALSPINILKSTGSTSPRQSDGESTPGNNTTEAHSPNDHGIFVGTNPKMSPLNPQYLPKKQTVLQKISVFVDKFKSVGNSL